MVRRYVRDPQLSAEDVQACQDHTAGRDQR